MTKTDTEPREAGSAAGSTGARSVLVVGGDIGALTTALDLANGGAEVYLVETGPFLGGELKERASFPDSGMPAYCRAISMIQSARRHPRIHVMTSTDVARVSKSDGGFEAKLRTAPTRVTDACDDCGACDLACSLDQSPMTDRLDSGCERCAKCVSACPCNALRMTAGRPLLTLSSRRQAP